MTQDQSARHCTVHAAGGELYVAAIELEQPERATYAAPRGAGRLALATIMPHELVCVRPDLELAAVVGLMTRDRLGCLPVVDEHRRPIGVITKFDICEQVDAGARASMGGYPLPPDLTAQTAEDVMLPDPLVIDERATIEQAAAMMISAETHHVIAVSSKGQLVGVVSAKDIVAWVMKPEVVDALRDSGCHPPVWHPFQS